MEVLIPLVLIIALSMCAVGTPPQTMTLSGVIRDQAPSTMLTGCSGYPGSAGLANGGLGFNNTDFEMLLGTYENNEKGLVGPQCTAANWQTCGALGADNTPVYAYAGTSPGNNVHSPASFYTWFHDSPQTVNIPINLTLTLQNTATNVYTYSNLSFFPIDGRGWKDHCGSPFNHNYAFCLEAHSEFQYMGGEIFNFMGDDDVWVYINRKLVLDLGGLHAQLSGSLNVDQIPNMQIGSVYPFDFFYCERHSTASDITLSTSLSFSCSYYDWCGVCQGNGQSCCTTQLCDDSNVCTQDSCPLMTAPSGPSQCVHTPVNCTGTFDMCHVVGCDPASGCYTRAISCNDQNACTVDTCTAAIGCEHTSISCDDKNACTQDSCDSSTGCVHTPISCDSDKCTVATCNETVGCQLTSIKCAGTTACEVASCDPSTGCVLTQISCDDNNKCTTDSCNAQTGCQHVLIPCNDNNECTADACNATSGCTNTPVSCNDANACTVDSCSTTTGCEFTPVSCNDGNACTLDSCNATLGCIHSFVSCNDANVCTIDSCSTTTGCAFTPVSCNDGNACTLDSCDATLGCIHSSISCDDANACTVDSCSTTTGCEFSPVSCDDRNACTLDTCNATLGCIHSLISCNDANACTVDSCSAATGCAFTPVSCNDENACTLDACNSTSGCSSTPINCDDDNECTLDSCDQSSGCTYTNITCQNDNVATCGLTVCSPASGCQFSPVIDSYWANELQNSWIQDGVLQTQWIARLVTGNIPLYSVTFTISQAVFDIFNANLGNFSLYSLPVWQYQDGIIPAQSSYVTFGYTINGPNPANITLSSGICAPEYTGCAVSVSNLLVNTWTDSTGIIVGQYNILVNNVGSRIVAHVNTTISPPLGGSISDSWNLIANGSEFECELWNLEPGQATQICGYNVNYQSAAPLFDLIDVNPLCV